VAADASKHSEGGCASLRRPSWRSQLVRLSISAGTRSAHPQAGTRPHKRPGLLAANGSGLPPPKGKLAIALLVLAALFGAAGVAEAQIDPERRANLEVGVEGPLRGDGPVSGYAFFLWNRPHFLDEDLYLRVVSAPTYLTSELVRDRWPTSRQAVGVGVGGGLFPYNFEEFRAGRHQERESFWGHGGEAAVSYYPRRLKVAGVLPVEGQLRLRPQYVVYQRSGDTDDGFRLPGDTAIYSGRMGVRFGGVPPELLPDVALELSLWHEASYRQVTDPYGFPERPQALEHWSQRSWGRLGGVATVAKTQTARMFVTAGATTDADTLSAFRLGSALPFRSEFPLVLHGYYPDEVFARRFWLVNASYGFPVWPGGERLKLRVSADYARIDYLPGHKLARKTLRGVGADLTVTLTPKVTLLLGYGYGLDAPRGGEFGGHEANAFVEIKF